MKGSKDFFKLVQGIHLFSFSNRQPRTMMHQKPPLTNKPRLGLANQIVTFDRNFSFSLKLTPFVYFQPRKIMIHTKSGRFYTNSLFIGVFRRFLAF
jgi:hypothetical protein